MSEFFSFVLSQKLDCFNDPDVVDLLVGFVLSSTVAGISSICWVSLFPKRRRRQPEVCPSSVSSPRRTILIKEYVETLNFCSSPPKSIFDGQTATHEPNSEIENGEQASKDDDDGGVSSFAACILVKPSRNNTTVALLFHFINSYKTTISSWLQKNPQANDNE